MLYYLFYRISDYFKSKNTDLNWQRGRALISLSGLLILNFASILFFTSTFLYNGESLLDLVLTGTHIIDKFIILPILILPMFILVYLFASKNADRKIEIFKNESLTLRKRRGVLIVIYIIFSVIIFQISLASPLFLR